MSKQVSKAAGNWLCQARLKAAKYNPDFLTRVGAVIHLSGITEDSLKKYEQNICTPSSEAIAIMADAYSQPEIINNYCSHECPLGKHCREISDVPPERTVLRIQNSLEDIAQGVKRIAEILDDGVIDEDEMKEIPVIRETFLEARRRFDEAIALLERAERHAL